MEYVIDLSCELSDRLRFTKCTPSEGL